MTAGLLLASFLFNCLLIALLFWLERRVEDTRRRVLGLELSAELCSKLDQDAVRDLIREVLAEDAELERSDPARQARDYGAAVRGRRVASRGGRA